MEPYWTMVETILAGTPAMRAAGEAYLPKFQSEGTEDYKYRRSTAKFTNIYRDVVENLANKPFAKQVRIVKGTSSNVIEERSEDIDGRGNNLHVFAASVFFDGINNGVDWILVDKPPVPAGATRAVERELGAVPYWVHIPAKRMLAAYSDMIGGQEEFVHVRIHEPTLVRDGYQEKTLNRVRELTRDKLGGHDYGPARYVLWEERKRDNTGEMYWEAIEAGPIAIGVISIVPFITGRRHEGSWRITPPMQDAGYLQVEHFQQETNLKSIKELAAFPMLAGNGIDPPVDEHGRPAPLITGPRVILYAPPNNNTGTSGKWEILEPSASTLTFLSGDVKTTELQLRELGRNPLTAQSGNLTVVTTAVAAQKGASAVQAWALNLKDTLEQAFVYLAMYMQDSSEPEVEVYTDFAVETESDKAPDFLLALFDKKVISREALIEESQRRDLLSSTYDADEDMEKITAAQPDEPTDEELALAAGLRQPPALEVVGGTAS